MSVIDTYLESISPVQHQALQHIREIIQSQVPDAEEAISYGMPTFKYKKKNLIHFAAFKDHMSLFPAGDEMVSSIVGVDAFRTSKGTLQFTIDTPIPDDMIKQIVALRVHNIDAGSKY